MSDVAYRDTQCRFHGLPIMLEYRPGTKRDDAIADVKRKRFSKWLQSTGAVEELCGRAG